MHDVVIVGIPLFAILAGILFNRNDVKELRAEIKDLRNDIGSLRSEVPGEIKDVRGEIKELRTEMRDGFAHINAICGSSFMSPVSSKAGLMRSPNGR